MYYVYCSCLESITTHYYSTLHVVLKKYLHLYEINCQHYWVICTRQHNQNTRRSCTTCPTGLLCKKVHTPRNSSRCENIEPPFAFSSPLPSVPTPPSNNPTQPQGYNPFPPVCWLPLLSFTNCPFLSLCLFLLPLSYKPCLALTMELGPSTFVYTVPVNSLLNKHTLI